MPNRGSKRPLGHYRAFRGCWRPGAWKASLKNEVSQNGATLFFSQVLEREWVSREKASS